MSMRLVSVRAAPTRRLIGRTADGRLSGGRGYIGGRGYVGYGYRGKGYRGMGYRGGGKRKRVRKCCGRRRGRGIGSKLAVLGPLALAGAMAVRHHLKKRRGGLCNLAEYPNCGGTRRPGLLGSTRGNGIRRKKKRRRTGSGGWGLPLTIAGLGALTGLGAPLLSWGLQRSENNRQHKRNKELYG